MSPRPDMPGSSLRTRGPSLGAASLAACLAGLAARPAAAQLFSPGELAAAHAHLEGLKHCLDCHEAGNKLSNGQCLACHVDLRPRVDGGRGFHGQASIKSQSCATCHPDHRGRAFALVRWPGGGKAAFDHGQTGMPLRGAHAGIRCEACHERRRIADEALLSRVRGQTFLGLPKACTGCHFDEHRGQLGSECGRCHDEKAWKPALGFTHDETRFALTGRHRNVRCNGCHSELRDGGAPAAFPAPRAPTYLRMKDIAFASCTSCHRDPHTGALGRDCTRCHSTAGWSSLSEVARTHEFHAKTRFPLRGAHAAVDCKRCHGPFGRTPAKMKGLAFATCEACHADAHVGQIAAPAGGEAIGCERCHREEGFLPTTFTLADHERTRYPISGAHRAIPCNRCHPPDPALADAVPAAVRRHLRDQGREVVVSLARFRSADVLAGCATCHTDPHAGQLAARPCEACHELIRFTEVRFEHDRDSRFPLAGKHQGVPCAACHRNQGGGTTSGEGDPVLYKPLDTACAACHDDLHLGLLADETTGTTACERCHAVSGWERVTYDHELASFPLRGRHRDVPCARCHPEVALADAVQARKLAGVPSTCNGCHVDEHAQPGSEGLAMLVQGQKGTPPCETCHSVDGWWGASFPDHERTAFPLRGAHAAAACQSCHVAGFGRLELTTCVACHRDEHGGELGAQCAGCHDSETWRSRFDVFAHRRTSFPLIGRHALIPCRECHGARGVGFTRAATTCSACHADDLARAALRSVDHEAAGFTGECLACHDTMRFRPARFAAHARCFAIDAGPHRGIACRDCHLTGMPSVTGACDSNNAACSSCHEHRCSEMNEEHDEVAGYQCRDRKCYECHRYAEP